MMMDLARDGTAGGSHTPLSLNSNLCPCPMHTGDRHRRIVQLSAARDADPCRALRVDRRPPSRQERNQTISDVNQKDWVSIITFDSISTAKHQVALDQTITTARCRSARSFRHMEWTGTEGAFDLAYNHIKPASQGRTLGREHTNKIVVLLTDGMPNQKRSSVTTSSINNYINNNASIWTESRHRPERQQLDTSGSYLLREECGIDADLQDAGRQLVCLRGGNRAGCDYDFMDRVARMGATANNHGPMPPRLGRPDRL